MRLSTRALGAILTAGLLLGACGGDDDSDGEPAASQAPGTTAATAATTVVSATANPDCSAVTAELVNEKLGMAVQGPLTDQKAGGTVCGFNDERGTPAATLQLNGSATAESFARAKDDFLKNGAPVNEVAGLGDEAYSSTFKFAVVSNTLVVRRGSLEVLITSTATADQVRALMDAVLAVL